MPLIIARTFERQNGTKTLSSYTLLSAYPDLFESKQARIFLNRIYNNKRKPIHEPKESSVLTISKTNNSMAKLDVTDIIEKYSVPTGYILELMVINLVKPKPIVHGSGTGEMLMIEYPIFPKEFIIECSDSEIEKKIEEETSSYQRISESYQAVGFLDQSGLSGIGDDLTKALTRFDKDDYEGSIKFFRKVLDALRYLSENKEITKSKNRNGAIKDFANKAFHLLSNFGEHHGTVGLEEDARLARDITVALATYVSKNFQVNK